MPEVSAVLRQWLKSSSSKLGDPDGLCPDNGPFSLAMNQWDLRKFIGLIAACRAMGVAVSVAWLMTTPSSHECGAENSDPRIIRAGKVVVRPWFGRHQAFGIFVVPKRYGEEHKYRATMSIRGLEVRFEVGEGGEVIHDSDVVIEEGYYPKLVFIPTRLVLWKVFVGQFWAIRSPCNWALEFTER